MQQASMYLAKTTKFVYATSRLLSFQFLFLSSSVYLLCNLQQHLACVVCICFYHLHQCSIHVIYAYIYLFIYLQRKYENLVSGTLPIESHLHQQLIEHLNSEIVLNTITTMDAARQWLKTTFFYIRARKNPHLYGFVGGIFEKKLFGK